MSHSCTLKMEKRSCGHHLKQTIIQMNNLDSQCLSSLTHLIVLSQNYMRSHNFSRDAKRSSWREMRIGHAMLPPRHARVVCLSRIINPFAFLSFSERSDDMKRVKKGRKTPLRKLKVEKGKLCSEVLDLKWDMRFIL